MVKISISLVTGCLLAGLFMGWSLPTDATAGEKVSEPLALDELIREAAERNPEILSARNRWQSDQEIIEARRAFPDPQISFTHFVKDVETRVGPQKRIFGAKQMFPFFGKRDARAGVAAKEAEAAKAGYEAVRQEVVRRVKKAYYEFFYLCTIEGVTHSEKEILGRFERVARTKYQTGEGNQQNILKAHVEITRLEDKLLSLRSQKQSAQAVLNTLLDRPAQDELGRPSQPELAEFPYTKEDLFALALENRPELEAGMSLVEKSDTARRLAELDYYPDFTVGMNYIQVDNGPLDFSDNGRDAMNVVVSMNVPLWRGKLSSQVNSAVHTLKAQKRNYDALVNQVLLEVEDGYFKIETARETLDLYRTVLIPQAEQSLKSAEAGYVSGMVGFLDLLDAERALLTIQYAYWRAYADYLKHVADMERAAGIKQTEDISENLPPQVKEG
jgi:cobalt-zinc-cadmium efflux system outer membrane protein